MHRHQNTTNTETNTIIIIIITDSHHIPPKAYFSQLYVCLLQKAHTDTQGKSQFDFTRKDLSYLLFIHHLIFSLFFLIFFFLCCVRGYFAFRSVQIDFRCLTHFFLSFIFLQLLSKRDSLSLSPLSFFLFTAKNQNKPRKKFGEKTVFYRFFFRNRNLQNRNRLKQRSCLEFLLL